MLFTRAEWEALGFCHYSDLPFESCMELHCKGACALKREKIDIYRAEIAEDLEIINNAIGEN